MKLTPYNPYTRARSYQHYSKACSNCGVEWEYEREYGHQHWHPNGCELLDDRKNCVVYAKCDGCGHLIRTRLKSAGHFIPKEEIE